MSDKTPTTGWEIRGLSGTITGIACAIDGDKTIPEIWKSVIKSHVESMAVKGGNFFVVSAFMRTIGSLDTLQLSVQRNTVNL